MNTFSFFNESTCNMSTSDAGQSGMTLNVKCTANHACNRGTVKILPRACTLKVTSINQQLFFQIK